ncbi:hypothetical protein [Flavobacterium pallidum]|uniref:UspA domain-containing protein n=1 Tax=Flavobacterium pallidum TaxID=2172098 RepID=A0A2S1SEC0_9FLAO|nr:hypothetical protein [Flavobacterium pallidum]AWI24702.1 hypothetical protein HYN49_01670 [Flavobacterium pallidum]
MKNILIPTILHQDTVVAVASAIAHAGGKPCRIILLQLQQVPENYSSASVLRSMKSELTQAQREVLETSRHIAASEPNCNLQIQTQYALSSPLLNHLLESLSADLVILSDSFKNSDVPINKYCVKLLGNCKLAILHVGEGIAKPEFSNALYLEKAQSKIPVEDLQQLLSESFSCKIVSRATVFADQDSDEIMPQLSETISRNNIDLLIEMRKPSKIKMNRKHEQSFAKTTGLPVLSVYEKVI